LLTELGVQHKPRPRSPEGRCRAFGFAPAAEYYRVAPGRKQETAFWTIR
jgi:hypothetical protein